MARKNSSCVFSVHKEPVNSRILRYTHNFFQNKWSSSVFHHLPSPSILYGSCILICIALSGIYCLLRNLLNCKIHLTSHAHGGGVTVWMSNGKLDVFMNCNFVVFDGFCVYDFLFIL